MKKGTELKEKLVNRCVEIVEAKLNNMDEELAQIQKSANEETKSSAGDKYETGRAMLMLEKEKLVGQKAQLLQQLKPLKTIDVKKHATKVELGAIIYSSGSNYFISSSIGKIEEGGEMFLAISALAPIAQSMLDKIEGESFTFNKTETLIETIL